MRAWTVSDPVAHYKEGLLFGKGRRRKPAGKQGGNQHTNMERDEVSHLLERGVIVGQPKMGAGRQSGNGVGAGPIVGQGRQAVKCKPAEGEVMKMGKASWQ